MLTDSPAVNRALPANAPSSHRQLVRSLMVRVLSRRRMLACGPECSRTIALTFDDGPHSVHTPAVLDVLREHGVRATFFVVGERVEACPDLTRRIVSDGHVIGHHSFRHTAPSETSASQLIREIGQTSDALRRARVGVPRLFRPPQGKLTAAKLVRLWLAGQTVVLWSVDPRDYAGPSSEAVLCRLQAQPLRPGDVVLLHDSQPFAAGFLSPFIRRLRNEGFDFRTVDQWTA